jgi:hypothetical protein
MDDLVINGRIKDIFTKLKKGMSVNMFSGELEGIIGEKTVSDAVIFHNNPDYNGSKINLSPEKFGYDYSFKITNMTLDYIEAIIPEISDKENCCYCLRPNLTLETINDKLYCMECTKCLFRVCKECGKMIEKKSIVRTEKYTLCRTCAKKNYQECNYCLYWHKKNNILVYKDMKYCKKCYKVLIKYCTNCEKLCHRDIDAKADMDGSIFCTTCWTDRFTYCYECHNMGYLDDMIWVDETQRYYCTGCSNNLAILGGGEMIHNYGYKPKPFFKKMKYENKEESNKDSVFMGVELEVQHNNVSNKVVDFNTFLKKERVSTKFYFKRDGSVESGFEIVTHPFTLKYAHRTLKFNKILNWLEKNKFTSYESGKCGLHIHLDKNFFDENDITKMRIFFLKNKNFIEKFSNRNGIGMNYCYFDNTTIPQILKGSIPSGRYWALNLNSSEDTVEMRIFRGTLDCDRFISILQFADAISNFVKIHGIASFIVGEYKYKNNSWLLFLDWAKKENKYNAMLNFFRKEKLLCV